MKLYYFPLSTYSQKVLMAMHEKAVEFEPMLTPLMDPEVGESYRREVNPMGKIPLLVLDDGHKIPESSIIIEYIDQTFDSGPRLIPADPELGRQTRFHDRIMDLYINDAVVTLLFESWKPEAERDAALIAQKDDRLDVVYRLLDAHLAASQGPWIMGEALTMADCAAAPPLFYAQQVKPFEAHENIQAYWSRLAQRDSWLRVMAEAAPHLDKLRRAS